MGGYTPGPWTSERQDHEEGDIYFAIHARQGYEFICNVSESEANARLIAAAPELLALAHRIAEYFENTDAPPGREAAALIARIEGR